MAIVLLNKKELKKIIGNVDDESIDEKIGMFGTAVERITEEEVEVEVAPNRPDMLSQQGLFRALRHYFKKSVKKYKVNPPEKNYFVKIDKSLKSIRPFTACAIVKSLKFDDEKIKEIIDIQEKLHMSIGRNRKKLAIGIYPLEKIALPITFTADSPEEIKFVPLEMSNEMTGNQILSKHPVGREYGHLLKGKEMFPVFKDANQEILSMPPIINSQMTGKITEKTRDVFVECSGFNLEILKKTLNIIVSVLADLGGSVYAMNLFYGNKKIRTPDLTPERMKIKIEDAEKLLGIKLKRKEIKKLLERMGYTLIEDVVEIPAYRTDILHPNDIYEDIAIAYGYQNFIPEIPQISTIGEESSYATKKRKISEILCGLGLLEISSYHLTSKKDIKKTGIRAKVKRVIESKTEYDVLRPSLLPSALRVLSENTDARYPQKIFELGKVFELEEENLNEKEKLAIVLSGETDFTEMKQILEYLVKMLDREYRVEEAEISGFIPGRVGRILMEEKEIGFLGEISPSILKNWNLKMPAVALEIEIAML